MLARYGNYIYAAVEVPRDADRALGVVSAFVDFYAWERGWTPLKAAQGQTDSLKNALRGHLFPGLAKDEVHALLRERRFVVLQGPPGTGKTRLAGELLADDFDGRGTAVQFHPAVTYETFVAAGRLPSSRSQHTATLAPSGHILVIGGTYSDGGSVEAWDPADETFRPITSLTELRSRHTATLLPDGQLVVIGGSGGDAVLADALGSVEQWDTTEALGDSGAGEQ